MRNIDWRQLFEKHGFSWNDELGDFIREYGALDNLVFLDGSDQINLLKSAYIELGSQYGTYDAASKYLGQQVAPVGDYHGLHIELLLTETGRLIGFCDYMLISWGSQHWRIAIPLILGGDTGFEIGVIP